MEDGLDVVAIRVQYVCRVVPGMIVTLAGWAVVSTAGGKCRMVEGVDGLLIRRLKCDVDTSYVPGGRIHEQLIRVEEPRTFVQYARVPEGFKDGLIEALAGLEIRYSQVNVIQQPSTMKFYDALVANNRNNCSLTPNLLGLPFTEPGLYIADPLFYEFPSQKCAVRKQEENEARVARKDHNGRFHASVAKRLINEAQK